MKATIYYTIFFFLFFFSCSDYNQNESNIQNETNNKIELVDKYITNAKNKNLSKENRINQVEKAYKILLKKPDNLEKRKRLTKISKIYKDLDDDFKFNEAINSSIKIAKQISDSSGLAFNYNRLALYYDGKNKLDSTYLIYSKADKIYSSMKKKQPFHHGRALLGMALVQRKVNNYTESISATIKAVKQFEKHKKADLSLSIAYSNLGIVSNNLEDYNNAIKYHKKSIKYAKTLKNREEREVLAYNNIGIIYKNQKEYKKAIEYFLKGLKYSEYLKKHPQRRALLLDNLAYSKFLGGQRNEIENLFFKSLKIRDSINDMYGKSINMLHLAEYYKTLGNDSLAIVYAEKTKNVSKSIESNSNLLDAYKILSSLSENGKGIYYANEYIKLNDSLFRVERLFRDKLAGIRFESENLEKENEQKNKEIVEVQNQNTIYFLGIILLITFIGFLIYFSRQRNRYLAQQNKIVEFQAAYEAETRISKRLHDELGNDIFQVMMQYQHDPHDPQITKKLNIAYTKARDISRENSEFEVDETYLEELTDMLTNYTKNNIRLVLRGIEKISWDTVDKNLKITIYRVLQELMTNMQKHSQADLVAVVFKNEKNKIIIKYSDNGVGIQKEDIKSKNGLRNTEKRMLAINGTIIFDSEKNKGFKAEIIIPS